MNRLFPSINLALLFLLVTACSPVQVVRTAMPATVSPTRTEVRPAQAEPTQQQTATTIPVATPANEAAGTPAPVFLQDLEVISPTNLARLKRIARFALPLDPASSQAPSLVFHPQGNALAYRDPSGESIQLLDLGSGQITRTYRIETAGCAGCALGTGPAFSPDGKRIATINADGPQVWDVATGTMLLSSIAPLTDGGLGDMRYLQEYPGPGG
jgi:hypothetical protein